MTADSTKMTLEQVIATLEARDLFAEASFIKAHLAPREVSDEDVDRAIDAYERAPGVMQHTAMRATLTADRQAVAGSVNVPLNVPAEFIELLARAEDVGSVDWTHMENGSWQKMRGLRTAIGMAKTAMLAAVKDEGRE